MEVDFRTIPMWSYDEWQTGSAFAHIENKAISTIDHHRLGTTLMDIRRRMDFLLDVVKQQDAEITRLRWLLEGGIAGDKDLEKLANG